jgi:DNA-binding NtrC family response regulator
MKPANVLQLNLYPPCNLGDQLRGVIESSTCSNINLLQEAIGAGRAPDHPESSLLDRVSRISPSVILLVSPRNLLRQAKSLFQSLRREPPEPPVVVVSDADAPGEMFEMIQLGAADFITPPLEPINILPRLWRLIENNIFGERGGQQSLNDKLSRPLIGESLKFREAVSRIPLVADTDATVFISGETGTGKEVCARAIHQLSPRTDRGFVAVNCGAIPDDLVESELFGHERGSFTGAHAAKTGLIAESEGGTLFLDELDSLPLMAQVKLLRFLAEGEYRSVGSNKTRLADVRVIAATNVNIEHAVRAGKIRQDLYYRLNLFPISLPPLRDRREDIPLLAKNFLLRHAAKYHKRVSGFSPDAMLKLCLHDWPGNVRELEHAIERAVIVAPPPAIRGNDLTLANQAGQPLGESLQEMKRRMVDQFERTTIQSFLIATQGNISQAAEIAKKNRRAFFELMRKHGIDPESFRTKD